MTINTFYERVFHYLFTAASRANEQADDGDLERNATNYGAATAYAQVLRDMGHEVDLPAWNDKGLTRMPYLKINDKKYEF